jgi:hypothetical protein
LTVHRCSLHVKRAIPGRRLRAARSLASTVELCAPRTIRQTAQPPARRNGPM